MNTSVSLLERFDRMAIFPSDDQHVFQIQEQSQSRRVKRRIARSLHWLYKTTLSWMFTGACRFHPTCSDYALEAIEVHGWFKGLRLAFQRVVRCHPYNPGGIDPVP